MPHPIKLIIFDLDGTLVDAYKAVSRSLNFALQETGHKPMSDHIIKRSVGWGEKVLVKKFVDPDIAEKTLAVYRRHHRRALKGGTKFLPGAKTVLRQLKEEGYKLAIASNRPSPFTRIILRYLGIHRDFSCVLCADQVRRPKPHGDLLNNILKRLSLRPSQALYVGDMVIDVQAGRNARVKTVAVLTGSSYKREIARAKPHKIINNIKELGALLRELNTLTV